jgi:hypothetical protein
MRIEPHVDAGQQEVGPSPPMTPPPMQAAP